MSYRTVYSCIKHHRARCAGDVEWMSIYLLGKKLDGEGVIVKDYVKGECDECVREGQLATPH